MGLSAGLIDDLLLLPQDYRSSSPGGEGNSSEHSRERESGEGTERKGERDRGRERRGGRQYENGRKDRRRQVGGKTEGEERGKETERIRRARWRQRGEGGDVQMCL